MSKLLEKWIPKTLSKETKCETILDKFTIKRNNTLLKSNRIILLATFQKKKLELAHKDSQSGKNSMVESLQVFENKIKIL